MSVDAKLDGQAESLGGRIEAGRREMQAALESEVARLEREDEDIKKRMAGDKLELSRRTDEVAQNVVRERDERVEACDKLAAERLELERQCDGLSKENGALKKEAADLRTTVTKEQEKFSKSLEGNVEDLRKLLDREMGKCRDQVSAQSTEIVGARKSIQGLEEESASKLSALRETVSGLARSCELPMSVCFNAVREEAYVGGGEEYLTFSSCTVNAGKGMDAKSGVFTAPVEGLYFFTLNVCSHDLKKTLVAIRRNGEEIASVYDQNHTDNHRNSMAGQVCLAHLAVGDKVQLYLYTFSGIFDKANNHLTQFCGFLMRPT